jgi:hypothetical protein
MSTLLASPRAEATRTRRREMTQGLHHRRLGEGGPRIEIRARLRKVRQAIVSAFAVLLGRRIARRMARRYPNL